MRPLLMFDDRDFDPDHEDRSQDTDLVHDLDLQTLWDAAAAGDPIVHASVRTAILEPLTDPAAIDYRNDALADCINHADTVRLLYESACHAIDHERQIYRASFYSRSSEALLNRSVTALQMFDGELHALREIADQHATAFSSKAFRRFFATIHSELGDDFFTQLADHLQILRFRDGIVASARLGRDSQGSDYVLRTPRANNKNHLLPHRPPVRRPYYSHTIHRDDERGHQDLAALRDRIVALAADSLAVAAEHVLSFFTALRAEIGFYIGCLNLHRDLTTRQLPVCRPLPHPMDTRTLITRGLYDPCLGLRSLGPVQGNDIDASGIPLIMVTGANQGGKSTFLRSLGLAHLMMQAGMPVPAHSFTASTVAGVFTHYAREEDATMTRGKFDEELQRMSLLARRIRPHALLLCNESFASTNEIEGTEIATDVLRALRHAGITVAFVTHLYELAHRLERENRDSTLFLRADHAPSGDRTLQLHPGPALPTSHGRDLYEHTFPPTTTN